MVLVNYKPLESRNFVSQMRKKVETSFTLCK